MPYLQVTTSAQLPTGAELDTLTSQLSEAVAARFNKPVAYVMVGVERAAAMRFAGQAEPAAFVSVRAVGNSSAQARLGLVQDVGEALSAALAVAPSRTFVVFDDVAGSHWGFNDALLG